MTLDELPEDAEERRVAVAQRPRPDDVQAAQQRREQRDDDRVRVEQRQGGEHDVVVLEHARDHPGVRHLVAVRPRCELRRARGAPGVDVAREVAGRGRVATAPSGDASPASVARYATVVPASGSSAGPAPPAPVGRSARSARAPVAAASRRASAHTFASSSGPAATMTLAPDNRTSSAAGPAASAG